MGSADGAVLYWSTGPAGFGFLGGLGSRGREPDRRGGARGEGGVVAAAAAGRERREKGGQGNQIMRGKEKKGIFGRGGGTWEPVGRGAWGGYRPSDLTCMVLT